MREYVLTINGAEYRAEVRDLTAETAKIAVNGVEYVVELKHMGLKEAPARPAAPEPRPAARPVEPPRPSPKPARPTGGGTVMSPLPGLVLDVLAKAGDPVRAGQKMMVLETMKMENHILAPFDGVVKSVLAQKGDTVSEGQPMFEIARPDMTTL